MCNCIINLLCTRENCNHHRLYETNQSGYYYYPTNGSFATANQVATANNGYFLQGTGWQNQYGCQCNRRCGMSQGGYYYDPVAVATAGQIENGTLTGNYYPRNGGMNQGCCHQRCTSTLAIVNCML